MGSGANACGETPVVGVVGRSGSGKTTLLESLVATLGARGLRVGVVKHASHGFLADRPGKDSYRLYEAGAESVALASAGQLATFTRQAPGPGVDVPLAAALQSLPADLDLVLVEGFSWEPIPRFVIVPVSEQPKREHLAGGEVLLIVHAPPIREGRKPRFPQSLITSIADSLSDLSDASRPVEADPSATWPSVQTLREHG
ncbi:MAG: molybdopterin-guanine dinucleotide biosynthesis protein B [Deltaproteobacteria bacterium]|nr:molybdopterin-guanine dinucleotide biosynthesis protein B [Deltaproteobacteria bacterium]MBW2393140.1 molybdopterin-guanine dinucleotide biosynthesis protein B [Deltaproteobacteria bacterium]